MRDLGVITDYTGITGFAIAFIFPALLHKESKRSCKKKGRETKTLYSGFFSEGDKFPNLMIAFGAFLVVFVFSSLVMVLPTMLAARKRYQRANRACKDKLGQCEQTPSKLAAGDS